MCDINAITKEVVQNSNSNTEYLRINAEWSEFPELKVKWARSYDFIHFYVTDYLEDAPENIIKGLMTTIMAKINGDMDATYNEATIEYLTSNDFVQAKRPVYVGRMKEFSQSRRLTWALKRLQNKGLVQGQNVCLGFGESEKDSQSSVLFKTAIINNKLAKADNDILDFVVYKAVKYMESMKFGDNIDVPELNYKILSSYPGWAELDEKVWKAMA